MRSDQNRPDLQHSYRALEGRYSTLTTGYQYLSIACLLLFELFGYLSARENLTSCRQKKVPYRTGTFLTIDVEFPDVLQAGTFSQLKQSQFYQLIQCGLLQYGGLRYKSDKYRVVSSANRSELCSEHNGISFLYTILKTKVVQVLRLAGHR